MAATRTPVILNPNTKLSQSESSTTASASATPDRLNLPPISSIDPRHDRSPIPFGQGGRVRPSDL